MVFPWFYQERYGLTMVLPWCHQWFTMNVSYSPWLRQNVVRFDQALGSTTPRRACVPPDDPWCAVRVKTDTGNNAICWLYIYIFNVYIYMAILDCESGYWWLALIEIPAVCGSCFLLVKPSTVWQHFHSYFTLFHRSHFFNFICFGESFAIPS